VVGVLLRFGGIGFVILLAIWLYCLLDVITTDESRVRNLPKMAWVLIVLLLFEVGAVAWLIAGRPRGRAGDVPERGGSGRRPPAPRPSGAPRGPLPPDDDPEFLAGLGRRQDEENRRMLDRWEAELRRREEDLRRREQDKGGNPGPDEPLH